MNRIVLSLGLAALGTGIAPAASMLGIDPPPGVIVNAGGRQWVWASPCAPVAPSCDVAVVLHHGFGIPTLTDWNASFASLASLVAAFLPGGVQLCASPYFSTSHNHCDTSDLTGGFVWGAPFSVSPSHPAAESFLVRGGQEVPEPNAALLLITGLAGIAGYRLRRNTI